MMNKVTIVNKSLHSYYGEIMTFSPVVYDNMEYAMAIELRDNLSTYRFYEVEPNFWVKTLADAQPGAWYEISFTEADLIVSNR